MIYIFYRDTSHNKVHSDQFDWMNYEKCFKSLLDTLDENCKLTIMFDGDTANHYVEKYQNKYKYDIVKIDAGNDFASNTKTFEYIKSLDYIKEGDIIGVFENDYLYLPWIKDVMTLYYYSLNYQMWENTYVSLFDHKDKYMYNVPNGMEDSGMYSNLKSQIYLGLTRYWRTTPSTCASFLMSKKVFDKDYEIHISGKADNSRFGELTKEPYNRVVLTPMPSLATHTNKYFFAPLINWKNLNDSIELL